MLIERFKNNMVLRLSFEFSISIIKYCNELHTGKQFVLANQLLKSATSIGANIMEAQNSESRADFIHKIKLQLKKRMKHNIGSCFVKIPMKTLQ